MIAVSEDVRSSMPERLEAQIEVLIHGVDVEQVRSNRALRDEVRSELQIEATEIVVGIVANYRKEKAYSELLAAAKTVIDRCPNVRFVSVGQGPLKDEIELQHSLLGLRRPFPSTRLPTRRDPGDVGIRCVLPLLTP